MGRTNKHTGLAEVFKERTRLKDWPPDGLMPPVRELAREYGVSLPTALKALTTLVQEGILKHDTQGGRYRVFAFDTLSSSASNAEGGPRFKRIARRLRAEIADGTFRGSLPLAKEMALRYGCSHLTLRKALHELESDGMVSEGKGRWSTASSRPAAGTESRIWITGSSALLRAYQSRLLTLVTGLERELQRQNWGLPGFYCTDAPNWKESPPPHRVAGFVHVMLGSNKPWMAFHKQRSEIPLVLVDLQESMRGKFSQRVLFRLMPDNHRAGYEVGRHLRELGHTRIAFVSHLPHDQAWIQRRASGLRDVFGSGYPSGREPVPYFGPVGPLASAAGDDAIDALPRDVEKRITELGRLVKASGRLPVEMAGEELESAYRLCNHLMLASRSRPWFEAALREPGVSAWVCANDDLAALAFRFLREKGLRPGADVALCGFDNAPISYHLGITSYDFQLDRFAFEALRCLQHPDVMAREGAARLMRGQLVMRESSARPA